MRVSLIIYGTLDTVSGGFLYDKKLVEYLISKGDSVDIISLPWKKYPFLLLQNFSSTTLKAVKKFHPDVILQDELNHPSLFVMNLLIRKKQHSPTVTIVHHLRSSEAHPFALRKIYDFVEKKYLKTVDGYIFNSRTTCKMVERAIGKTEKPHIIVYPSGNRFAPDITDDEIIRRSMNVNPLRVLHLGSIIPRKGLDVLINAISLLNTVDIVLDVVGPSQVDRLFEEKVKKLVDQKCLDTKVFFRGILPQGELGILMGNSHVLAVPSYYEGFGIAYLEGFSYGLPAIASMNGGAKEIIHNGINGVLVKPGNPEALASELGRFAQDSSYLIKMSLAARKRFLEFPGWQESMEKARQFLLSFT